MANKTIKNSMVTREQYDKLQVDVVNRLEEVEAKEAYDAKQVRGQISRATDRLYAEIRTLQERQEAQESHTKTLSILWGMLAFMTIVSVLLLAASIRNIYPLL